MIGRAVGRVIATRGTLVEALLPTVAIGSTVRIEATPHPRWARVAALDGARATLAPIGTLEGIALGDRVSALTSVLALGPRLLGRSFDAASGLFAGAVPPLNAPLPADRRPLTEPAWTGVRAIDGPLAFARGARIGLFGAPGCGKSTLLETIARGTSADVVVVGLVGERGREAERWCAQIDGRTTVVCATSDRAATERVHAAEAALAHADALRRAGLHVLVILDSLARVAAAQREIALALGEAPGRAGYPPSVFALLARLVEMAGNFERGSITVIATVLSDGPDAHDPVGEACRALLDGHLVLSERLAQRGWFPAIDVPASASRTLGEAAPPAHVRAAGRLRAAVAALDETREARQLGLDPAANDPFLARVLAAEPDIERFLRQSTAAPSGSEATLAELMHLADRVDDGHYD